MGGDNDVWAEMATHVCGYSVACGGKWHDVWVELVRFVPEMALSVGRDGKACRWRLGRDGTVCGRRRSCVWARDSVACGRRWRGIWAEMARHVGGDGVAYGWR